MADMNKYPQWCCTCFIRKPKDICEWCKVNVNDGRPNGYRSEKEEREINLELLHESNALNT